MELNENPSRYTEHILEKGVGCLADIHNDTMQFQAKKKNKASDDHTQRPWRAGYDPREPDRGLDLRGLDLRSPKPNNNARYMIRILERDELLEELVRYYVQTHEVD